MTAKTSLTKVSFIFLTVCIAVTNSFGQTATATYSAGNIATTITNYSGTCNGPTTPLVVTIPAGASVTGINISYNMTALGSAWRSEQRSRIHCQQTGNTEATFNGTGGNSAGLQAYNRTGVSIANGVSATGTLTFEMRAWRTWGGSACDQVYQFVNNNSWTITVNYFIPGPMGYTSSTTTQNNTSTIQNCALNAEMARVRVVTTGSSPTINLTALTIGTAGTTSLANVSAVNIYYTGSSSTFASTNLFGTAAPGASVVVGGTQTLQMGNNYFWVEYQLTPTLTTGNIFDASCSQITVAGMNYTPTVTNPAGSRTVGLCNPAPGGVSGNLQTWFDANVGTVGTPVTTWANIGPNANITQLTSPSGGNMSSNDLRSNYNNLVSTTASYNGTFHAEVSNRTQVISGNEVTMYCAYQRASAPDLTFEFHGSTQTSPLSNWPSQWLTWGFRHAGIGTLYSSGTYYGYDNAALAQVSENSNFVGLHGRSTSSGGNSINGSAMSYANIGAFASGTNFMELSIGYWPGYGTSRGFMEAVLWDSQLNALDRNKVETYLAIKYGVTKGINGTSINYVSPFDAGVIWDITANTGFNYDIAGILRSDASRLDQRKSHSTNGPSNGNYNDIVTMAHGTNFSSPVVIPTDGEGLVWGHNNGPLINTGVLVSYPTDNGETIEAIFTREWKSQEAHGLGTVTIEFDLSDVIGVGGVVGVNDLQYVRLLVDEDGNYTTGATSIAPTSYNNATGILYFQHNFIPSSGNILDQNRGFFFTIASTSQMEAPLPVTLLDFDVENFSCETSITWSTASEQHCDYFRIDRSYDLQSWEEIAVVNGADNSSAQLDYQIMDREFDRNGPVYYQLTQFDTDGTPTILGTKGVQAACSNNEHPVIYPNPSSGLLNVFTPIGGSIAVIDIQGRIITTETLLEGENILSFENLAPGTYTASVLLDNGKFYREQWVKM